MTTPSEWGNRRIGFRILRFLHYAILFLEPSLAGKEILTRSPSDRDQQGATDTGWLEPFSSRSEPSVHLDTCGHLQKVSTTNNILQPVCPRSRNTFSSHQMHPNLGRRPAMSTRDARKAFLLLQSSQTTSLPLLLCLANGYNVNHTVSWPFPW